MPRLWWGSTCSMASAACGFDCPACGWCCASAHLIENVIELECETCHWRWAVELDYPSTSVKGAAAAGGPS